MPDAAAAIDLARAAHNQGGLDALDSLAEVLTVDLAADIEGRVFTVPDILELIAAARRGIAGTEDATTPNRSTNP